MAILHDRPFRIKITTSGERGRRAAPGSPLAHAASPSHPTSCRIDRAAHRTRDRPKGPHSVSGDD
jgi:hypothetical protein